MNAPLIWIAFPFALAVALFFLSRRTTLVMFLAAVVCFVLAGLALVFPIGQTVTLGPLSLVVTPDFNILGRRLLLDNADRTLLLLIYAVAGVWLLGARAADTNRLFVPIGLGVLALLVSVLAVEPFLYAALLVEIAVLLSVPMLAPIYAPVKQGVIRFVIFQTLAMPFILLAGWALAAIEANPAETALYVEAELFLGLGFAFWLGVFPFYTWVPMLAEQVHPYIAGFVLNLLFTAILILSLSFLDTFAWLRASQPLFNALRLTGLLMVGSGGIWAAFQRNQARLVGYALIVETGYSLLALSLGFPQGPQLFTQLILPRLVGMAVLVLALSIWQRLPGFQGFGAVDGLLRRAPVVAIVLLLAYFSLGGLPLLAGFPPRQVLLEQLATRSLPLTLWVLIGNLGFLVGGLRSLALMASGQPTAWQFPETRFQTFMLAAGALVLFLMGLFPGWFLSGLQDILLSYTHLK